MLKGLARAKPPDQILAGLSAHARVKRDRYYHDSGIDYDRLQVPRNAPCWPAKLSEFGYLPAPTRTA